jgi:hypothetical protein
MPWWHGCIFLCAENYNNSITPIDKIKKNVIDKSQIGYLTMQLYYEGGKKILELLCLFYFTFADITNQKNFFPECMFVYIDIYMYYEGT